MGYANHDKMADILLEQKVKQYYSILREKGVKIKDIEHMPYISVYNSRGLLKPEGVIDGLIIWAKSIDPNKDIIDKLEVKK